jgi:hypothetical protein
MADGIWLNRSTPIISCRSSKKYVSQVIQTMYIDVFYSNAEKMMNLHGETTAPEAT